MPPRGVDYIKLPTIVKTGDTTWQASTLGISLEATLRLRSRLIEDTFSEYDPDLVLVDHMPVGALGELKPMLDRARSVTDGPRLFLGLRDVLDNPEVIRRVWTQVGGYDYLSAYDAVLVYGSPDLLDAAEEYGFNGYARRVVTCNYVAVEADVPQQVNDDEPLILVMGGGGADLYPVAKTFLQALPALLAETRFRAVVLPGPNMPQADLDALDSLASGYPVEVVHSFEDATVWLAKASAVVMMAGYNSMCEVMSYRKKALVIPRPGPSEEQRIRSRIFADRRLIHLLDPDDLTASRLTSALIGLLADDRVPDPANIPALDGAKRAADVLLGDYE